MANVLSQDEIDQLLNALSSGEEPEPVQEETDDYANAKVYDFRTANKFPKEQIRTLNIVFQTFSQLCANQLTNILRTACEFETLSVEELSYNEFNNSLPSPVILAVFDSPPMPGQMIMQVSPEASYMIIARLLGGTKSGSDSSSQFTEIELALMERVLRQLLRSFGEAWDKVFSVAARLDRIETSSQFAQIVALNEPIAVVTLNLTIAEESGLISICIPHASIEPVSKLLSTRSWYTGSREVRQTDDHLDVINSTLTNTLVTMAAYFNDTPATVSDIANLQIGDVIRLNQSVSEPLTVNVQHIPKFHAKIGTSGSNYAMQVIDIIKEDDEDESFAG